MYSRAARQSLFLVKILKLGPVRVAIVILVNSTAVINLSELVFISLYFLVPTILLLSNCA